ncbi:hypothetical protein [Arthrospiribacter ruber]|uniref:Uncharacterized protein n=1 Tax=Arthrospiribacter ruber TaxID=2487934 RepID=A0A951IZ81_9BACT|nr:hypothetical protein [Arthrospiribacter ruber]MBW3469573.1 hypothetical protein [Arthrospiribacter ruber]
MDCNCQILVETDAYLSTYCDTCSCVQIQDGIYVFGFTIPALKEWGNQILNLDYDKHCKCEGEFNYLTIYSYIHHYEFHFFREQFEEFQDLIGQTLLLLEVKDLVNKEL